MRDRIADERGFGLVEALIALTILAIGLVAVCGLSLATAAQARIANWRTRQATAAQIVLEDVQKDGWDSAVSRADTVSLSGHDYTVTIGVTDISSRVKQVTVVVRGVGDMDSRIFTTRLYKPRPLPDPVP
jgi:prepilin-type N-terminal cleavage/methylation domain-containing protein